MESARAYLADYFHEEEGWQHKVPPELPDWFVSLSHHVGSLELTDPRLAAAATYLEPFLDDHDDVDSLIYVQGEAIRFMEDHWGGDVDSFFSGFVAALKADHTVWLAGGFRNRLT